MQQPLDELTRKQLVAIGVDRIRDACSLRDEHVADALAGRPVKGRVRYTLSRLALRLRPNDPQSY